MKGIVAILGIWWSGFVIFITGLLDVCFEVCWSGVEFLRLILWLFLVHQEKNKNMLWGSVANHFERTYICSRICVVTNRMENC